MPSPEFLRFLYIDQDMTIGQVAKAIGVGHRKAKRLLLESGITLRTMSEEKRLRISLMTYEQRLSMTAAGRSVITGRKRSHDDLCKRARTKQDRAQLSGDELVILEAMHAAGLHPVPLLAVDKFNIDFGFADAMLAVEYHGGNWHNSAAKQAQDARKREYLEAHGWRVIVFPRIRKGNRHGSRSIQVEALVKAVHGAVGSIQAEVASTQFG